ncbi:MAG: S41 family peptidase [Rikenellaceae bacterium]
MKRLTYIGAIAALSLLSICAIRNDFGLSRNIEIMVNLMREISENYVDEVDPDLLLEYAAEGISRRLDPYTEYLPEEEMTSFEILTTGKYGGIGSLIRQDSDYVMIAQPYQNSPADKAGLIIGDRIVAIDGESAKGFTTEQVSSKLKGTPNSDVTLTVRRLITGQDEDIVIRRERISIPGIPYYGFVGDPADSIGYIQHSDFTAGVAKDMRAAIVEMQKQGLKGLILDYRNNGGGILQEAVDVVSLFTPRGTEVVKIKGRRDSMIYRTTLKPLSEEIPLVVLINENSASAAEIVSGSLQDLDRAVLIGQKSFGKGLVQSPRPVGYNSYVKLTTSKYYIPSGRCIQELDYSDHSSMGKVVKVADSLRHEFTTQGGRKVYDGGGITPDEELKEEYMSRFAATLYALGHIDRFGDNYFRENHQNQIDIENFSISDSDYEKFKEMLIEEKIEYESSTRGVLKALKEAARTDLYADVAEQIEELEANLKDDTSSNLETYRSDIIESINSNIILRYAYAAGVVQNSICHDDVVARATEILLDNQLYNSKLTPTKE